MATTGVVATAAAGVLSPMAANKANTAGRLLELAACGDIQPGQLPTDVAAPAWHQFVLPVPVGGGDGLGRARGALLSTTVALLAATAATVVIARTADADSAVGAASTSRHIGRHQNRRKSWECCLSSC